MCELTRLHDGIFVRKYVIMPNHIHMIIVRNTGGASAAPTMTLGYAAKPHNDSYRYGASLCSGYSSMVTVS